MTSGFTPAGPGAEMVVPGSISNLGPGFDTLSVAVQLYLRIRVLEIRPDAPDTLEVRFVGPAPAGENRIDTAFRLARGGSARARPGSSSRRRSEIPVRAGLGSSAAATIAGLRLYEAAHGAHRPGEWLAIARELEGHPDNAAAALLGGLTLSCQHEDGRVIARVVALAAPIRLVVATPDVPLETRHSRERVLPRTMPMRDAVFNLQRALLLVRALETGDYDDLRRGDARPLAPAVSGSRSCRAWRRRSRSIIPAMLGVCLSGAGPSISRWLDRGPGRPRPAGRSLGRASTSGSALPHTIRIA